MSAKAASNKVGHKCYTRATFTGFVKNIHYDSQFTREKVLDYFDMELKLEFSSVCLFSRLVCCGTFWNISTFFCHLETCVSVCLWRIKPSFNAAHTYLR